MAGRRRAYWHGPGESVARGDRRRSEQGLEALRRRSPARANARRVESPEPKKRRFAPKPESGPIFLPHIGQFFIAYDRASLRSDHCPISSDQCPIRIGTGVRFHRNTQVPPRSSGRIDDLLSFWAQWLSATFWNSRKVGGLKFAVLPDPQTRFLSKMSPRDCSFFHMRPNASGAHQS